MNYLNGYFLNLGSYFYLVYQFNLSCNLSKGFEFVLTLQKILDTNQIWCELMKFSGFDFDFLTSKNLLMDIKKATSADVA